MRQSSGVADSPAPRAEKEEPKSSEPGVADCPARLAAAAAAAAHLRRLYAPGVADSPAPREEKEEEKDASPEAAGSPAPRPKRQRIVFIDVNDL